MFKTLMKKWLSYRQNQCVCHSRSKNLCQAITGQRLKIECLHGEEGLCQRLREMGFCESSVVEKIADSGSLICKVCDAKVIIGKDLARNIIVKDICSCQGHHHE